MPNVPKLPGVPTLSSYGSFVASRLVADVISSIAGRFLTRWGIFKSGVPIVLADNVVDVSFKQDWNLATYPIEKGGFESYDKVSSPFESRVRFSAGGSNDKRQNLLESIASIGDSLDLFNVVTPEKTYIGVNMSHYDYQRSADRGVGLLVIDTWWLEIRQTAQAAFSSTKIPSGASAVSGGTVQTIPATSAQNVKVMTPGALQ